MKGLILLSVLSTFAFSTHAQVVKKRLIVDGISTETKSSEVTKILKDDPERTKIVEDFNAFMKTTVVNEQIDGRNEIIKDEVNGLKCAEKETFDKYLIDKSKTTVVLKLGNEFIGRIKYDVAKVYVVIDGKVSAGGTHFRNSKDELSFKSLLRYSLYRWIVDFREDLKSKEETCLSAKRDKEKNEKSENLLKGYTDLYQEEETRDLGIVDA